MTNHTTPSAPAPDEGEMEKAFSSLTDCIVFLDDEGYGISADNLTTARESFRSLQSRLKQAEAELESSSKKARELLELANDGHFGTKNRVHLIQSLSSLSNQYSSSI